MKSKELCIYLERLRNARNISQEAFTENVVSLRQYRRYLTGESDIPFQVIHQLTVKLSVKTDTLLREFENVRVEETSMVTKMYNLVANLSFKEFLELSKKYPLDDIIETGNRILYEHSLNLYRYYARQITREENAKINMKLINYPKILNQQVITAYEMLILSSFLDFLDNSHHERIIAKISEFIENQSTVISGQNERIFSFVLARLSKHMGILEEYKKVIEYCSTGIERSLESRTYYLLEYFYYYSALAYFRLGNKEKYTESLVNCFHAILIDRNESKMNKFRSLINEDFDINFDEFVIKYYQENMPKESEKLS